MNIHHLELFYYVARHRGIAEAVRRIPWGIQQPAVSSQIGDLERSLGVSLFQRRPFSLTKQGEELYRFIEPFFGNVDAVAERIRGSTNEFIRIAASAMVLRDYLPLVLRNVREKFPRLRFTLQEAGVEEAAQLLERQEADLAVAVLDGTLPKGIKSSSLIELSLALIVPTAKKIRQAADLWKQGAPSEPLISLPRHEPLAKAMHEGLAANGVHWNPEIEVSSLDLIESYVAGGFGVGLAVAVPGRGEQVTQFRRLPLDGFPTIRIAACWSRALSPAAEALLEEMRHQAKLLAREETAGSIHRE